jgi:uncharacterized membrane protein YgcG
LSFDKASTFVHEHGIMQAKIKLKERNKNSQEKCDDNLKRVEVPAGLDDAQDNLNIEARKLRPVNKEISEQMTWMVRERKGVVRNLPLDVYGLADSVATKPIELCIKPDHDMFCPGGKKSTTTKQTACKTKDGELAVETSEVYGDLDSIQDVLLAWSTLSAIWQKVFPEWPAAQIAMRVIFKMKMFQHCNSDAKEVMIAFSNRFLTSNSQRAASKKGPLSYERAMNLAGTVSMDHGYSKEPPAVKGKVMQPVFRDGARGRGGQQGGQHGSQHGSLRGGRGGGGGGRGSSSRGGGFTGSGVKLGNDVLCHFFQVARS